MEVEMNASGVHHHHHQEISSQTLESMLVCTKAQQEKKPRPAEEALKCPRCDSTNTKFCYYNNYSLTQPRYFCKSCRRYWTKGGTLRNVPVGGGCRKNKRPSSSSSSSATSSNSNSSSSKILGSGDLHQHLTHYPLLSGLPHLPYDSTSTDLSLAFARLQSQSQSQVNTHLGFDQFDYNTPTLGADHLGSFLGGFLDNGFQNVLYNGGNVGNGDMGCVETSGILMGSLSNSNLDHDHHEIMNPSFHHHQEHMVNNNSGAETPAVTVTTVKQETCHGKPELGENRGGNGGGVLWGFPWQMGVGGGGDQGNNWHGLLNSPLM